MVKVAKIGHGTASRPKRGHGRPAKPTTGRGAASKVWEHIYLKEWRKARGLTMARLEEKSGVSEGMISQIETKKSAGSPDSLEKIAAALDCTVGELLDIKPEGDGAIFRAWVHKDDRAHLQIVAEALTKQRQGRA